ncbi:MAG: hypothetical protein C0603_01955 [Denitrovibrio sp.]|nr:MAG: hypothetical protein C0603_01955 [Denitrovibrio sp.]
MRRVYQILIFPMFLFLLTACGGGGGGSSTATTSLTDTVADFSGSPVSVTTDSSGDARVNSGSLIDTIYNLSVSNSNGGTVNNVEIGYTEDGSLSLFFLSDVSGETSDAILLGTPAELAARSAGRSLKLT